MSNTPSDELRLLLQETRSALWQPANAELCERIDDALARWAPPQPVVRESLTDEQIAEMMRETWGCASIAPRYAMGFARTIEAEVRKQDDALIRQLVEALEALRKSKRDSYTLADDAITAARARLGEKT